MAQPGDVTHRFIRVTTPAGVPVAGLTLASFTLVSYARGYGATVWTTYAAGAVLVDYGGGLYGLQFSLPPSAGWWRCMLLHATNAVWNGSWEGEVETQDQDSLYGAIIQPVATLSTGFQLGQVQPAELIANRYRVLTIAINDSAGAPYTALATDFPSATLKLSIRSKDQTTVKWDAGPSGIITTGGGTAANFAITTVGNVLSIAIPEDAGFFTALAAGVSSTDLYAEVTGDYTSSAAKTQPVIRSSVWTISRREVGT